MALTTDVVIVGGGIAGLSLAAAIGGRARARLLEQEDALAQHTSARSARQMQPTYGPRPVQVLTSSSIELVRGFEAELGRRLLKPRPLLWLGLDGNDDLSELIAEIPGLTEIPVTEAFELLPILRKERVAATAIDRAAHEVDVPSLLDYYAARARAAGAEITTGARVESITRSGSGWVVTTADTTISCALVVNAAGAWASRVGALAGATPIALTPYRRTVIVADPATLIEPHWPMASDAESSVYFRPDGQQLLSSPLEDTAEEPHDAKPLAEIIEQTADKLRRLITPDFTVERAWTGLRTLADDGVPVLGQDPEAAGFFWLAGQGGYGIQTSASFGRIAAAQLLGETLELSAEEQAAVADISPVRFGVTAA